MTEAFNAPQPGNDPKPGDGAEPVPGTSTSSPSASSSMVLEPHEAFAELGRIVLGDQPIDQVMRRIADLACACVPGAEEVSITLIEGEKAYTPAFTGDLALTLDEQQYEAGFGPCVDAAQSGHTIRIDDAATDTTYPDFAAACLQRGVHSSVSLGLPLPQRILGAINVYRFSVGPLDEAAETVLDAFAGYAAVSLANASLFASTAALAANVQTAMQSRAVIDQAKGVLVAQLRCSPDDAFQHLVKLSQRSNRKLRDIAAEIVQQAAGG